MRNTPSNIPQSLQDILPKWAHFCLYTERFITHELKVDLKGKHLVVGFSGGVDSTALLLVLNYLSVRNDCRLTAAHLNHSLRPEADADADWVKVFCAAIDVDCVIRKEDVASRAEREGIGVEEAGRNVRYEFFADVLKNNSADYVATGHHLGDLSEDVLMRFIRGTGWPGLAGMSGYDSNRNLIRPFLMLPKSTLKAFVTYLKVEWREDLTNQENDATRNRIRNELLPLIIRENPNFPDSMARLWKIGQVEGDFWDETASFSGEELPNSQLHDSHKAVRLRLYKSALAQLGQGQALAHTLFKLDEAWCDRRVGATFQFPGDKIATITSSGVVFSTKH